MIRFTRTSLLSLAAVAALYLPIDAHAQVVGGTISGAVTDATGAGIPNAQVVVHNDETGNERRLVTGPDGRYFAPSIPVGSYTVTAQANGFSEQRRTGVALSVGQAQRVDLSLGLTGVAETIVVKDTPPVVNLSTEQTSGLVDAHQVKEL